jgi:hypothetical protein
VKSWAGRPTELAYLFNPAFCGWVLREAVEGYTLVRPGGMTLPLAFLILPVVLHRPTRQLMPRAVTTKLHVWLQEHPEVRARKRIIVTLRPSSSRYQAVRSSHLQRLIFYGP